MSDRVTLIYCSEDGDHSISFPTKAQVLKDINSGDYGENPRILLPSEAKSMDLNEYQGYIIIDGGPICPKAAKIVERYEF